MATFTIKSANEPADVAFHLDVEDGDLNLYANNVLLAFIDKNGEFYRCHNPGSERERLTGLSFNENGQILDNN